MKIALTLIIISFTLIADISAQKKPDIKEISFISPAAIEDVLDSNAFTPISQKEYFETKSRYDGRIRPDKTVKPDTKGYIRVNTKNYSYELISTNDYSSSYDYIGYSPELRSHLISHCSESACNQFLLDNETDNAFSIPSGYDSGPSGLSISPENNYMVTYSSYYSDDFDDYYLYRSVLHIFSFAEGEGLQSVSYFKQFETGDWSIDEIIWEDNNTIALKTYIGNQPETDKYDEFIYLKVDISED